MPPGRPPAFCGLPWERLLVPQAAGRSNAQIVNTGTGCRCADCSNSARWRTCSGAVVIPEKAGIQGVLSTALAAGWRTISSVRQPLALRLEPMAVASSSNRNRCKFSSWERPSNMCKRPKICTNWPCTGRLGVMPARRFRPSPQTGSSTPPAPARAAPAPAGFAQPGFWPGWAQPAGWPESVHSSSNAPSRPVRSR